MDKKNEYKHLAWFLGPKSENADYLEDYILQVLRDYTHWRKNYFPDDPILITKKLKSQFVEEYDRLDAIFNDLMARLRRNFPFYSPRYIGHELSDTMLSATIGYFAGMLFNPNNVTPEAAPVTAELEIEVGDLILSMLGYEPSPPPLKSPKSRDEVKKYYEEKSEKGFGWAHLTSGGTVANIEALWLARQIKYFPLAIRDVILNHKVDIEIRVTLPGKDTSEPIQNVDPFSLLLLKPNESIALLGKYIIAIKDKTGEGWPDEADISIKAWTSLRKSPYSLDRGFAESYRDHPPVILVAGTRHYSISKAVDIIGIGQANIEHINTDENFRLDIKHLEEKLRQLFDEKKIPLCVIASAGTTEEGAVDPIDEIVKLRSKLEKELNFSFWIHIDAAWGGFIRSLFCLTPKDRVEAAARAISRTVDIRVHPPTDINIRTSSTNTNIEVHSPTNTDIEVLPLIDSDKEGLISWHKEFSDKIKIALDSKEREAKPASSEPVIDSDREDGNAADEDDLFYKFAGDISGTLLQMDQLLSTSKYEEYLGQLSDLRAKLSDGLPGYGIGSSDPDTEAFNWVNEFVSTNINIGRNIPIEFPDRKIFDAFLAFPEADSITVDPHKMGYAPYPSGCIAFKDDRVRSFIYQQAPYITSATQESLAHFPPRHLDIDKKKRAVREFYDDPFGKPPEVIESFSPFILEGSKPGMVSAGLWLAYKTVPLVPRRHGRITRASVLAARSLYEWLKNWDSIDNQHSYEFIPITPRPPDTNLVAFIVKPKNRESIQKANLLTSEVYETFTIHAEFGERKFAYNQAFFLSKTEFKERVYPADTLEPLFNTARFKKSSNGMSIAEGYKKEGLVVLRAAVMNPYIMPCLELVNEDFIGLFMEELGRAAASAITKNAKELT